MNINAGGLSVYIINLLGANQTINFVVTLLFYLVAMAAAYLLGSVNSAIIISKALYHDDIRAHGSGNAGMTNMLRTYGLGAASLTLLGDMLKTIIAIAVAGSFFGFGYMPGAVSISGECYVAGLVSVLGHIFPIYYKFKGGKGVLSTATIALVLSPIPFVVLLLIFIGIVAATKYVSLGSVTGVMLYPVILHGYFNFVFGPQSTPGMVVLPTIILAILIVWMHRGNLQRISNRTERKISFKKKEVEHKPKKKHRCEFCGTVYPTGSGVCPICNAKETSDDE